MKLSTTMTELHSFGDLISQSSKNTILLGNGFSIAIKPNIFTYGSLYQNADFSKAPEIPKIFDALRTTDFEVIIRHLQDAATIIEVVRPRLVTIYGTLRADANVIKEILVKAIAGRHPERPYDIGDQRYKACRAFLRNFDSIFSLNYDVLLYWALMKTEVDGRPFTLDDGFRHPEEDPSLPYVSWQQGNQAKVQYLHGALHLFDSGAEITKYTWSKTETPIIDQIRAALQEDRFPLFVSEGESKRKYARILHNAYLHKAFRSFEQACRGSQTLFVFGHSLAAQDDHVLKCISRGTIPRLCVSIFGDPEAPQNAQIINRAQMLASKRPTRKPLQVDFFDARSAKIWG